MQKEKKKEIGQNREIKNDLLFFWSQRYAVTHCKQITGFAAAIGQGKTGDAFFSRQ